MFKKILPIAFAILMLFGLAKLTLAIDPKPFPGPPILTYPVSRTDVSLKPNLQWNKPWVLTGDADSLYIPDSNSYEIWYQWAVSRNTIPADGITGVDTAYSGENFSKMVQHVINQTSYSLDLKNFLLAGSLSPNTNYYWAVRARRYSVDRMAGGTKTFLNQTDWAMAAFTTLPLKPPVIIQPLSDGYINFPVNSPFVVQVPGGGAQPEVYGWEVWTNTTPSLNIASSSIQASLTSLDTSISHTTLTKNTPYILKVKAGVLCNKTTFNIDSCVTKSDVTQRTFTTELGVVSPPVLISPGSISGENISVNFTNFALKWQNVEGISRYSWQINELGGGIVCSSDSLSGCGASTSTASGYSYVSITKGLEAGKTYLWKAESCWNAECTTTNTPYQFTVTSIVNNLTVTKAGTGTGTVTPSPAGVSCGSACYTYASGTVVTLTAATTTGNVFASWSGCTGSGPTCTLTMDAAKTVTATFNLSAPPGQYTLTVNKGASTGSGTVTSSPIGINCGSICSASYNSGVSVILTALAASGSTFAGWSGTGVTCTGATCTLIMDGNKTVTATFHISVPPGQYSLTVFKVGNGTGTVTPSPSPAASCGPACYTYNSGTVVTLTAATTTGNVFTGWSGTGVTGVTCTGATCTLTMNANKNVIATFNLSAPPGCTGSLSVTISGSGTCTVNGSLTATNCNGKSWEIRDGGNIKCSGTVSGDSYSFSSCPSWTVPLGSYTYKLYVDGTLKDTKPVTCSTTPPPGVISIQNPLTAGSFEDIINNLIDFIFKIAIVLAPLMVIIGGFLFMTAGGNIQQITQAKNLLIWTVIGLLVILLSKGILAIINLILGVR